MATYSLWMEEPGEIQVAESRPEGLSGASLASTGPASRPRLRRARTLSGAVVGVQFAGMVAYSSLQYSRFGLGIDFSMFNQAAWQVAHGHLDPQSSITGYRFLSDHFSLLIWPIGLLARVFPSGIVLLVLQDAASAGAGLVALWWVIEILERRLAEGRGALTPTGAQGMVALAVAVVVLDPWVFQGISFDFHFEAIAALFLALAFRAFWNRRIVPGCVWSLLVLASGDFGGLYLVGLGVGIVLAGAGIRRYGVGVTVAGAAWIALTRALHDNRGDAFVLYSYLVTGRPGSVVPIGVGALARAMVVHPSRWLSTVGSRSVPLYQNLAQTGLLGLVAPWTAPLTLLVFLSATIIGPEIYLVSGFQTVPAFAIGMAGTVMVLVAILGHPGARRPVLRRRAVTALQCAIVLQTVVIAAVVGSRVPATWFKVSPAQAAVLARVDAATPPSAEVIGSWGVLGRFSTRRWVYPLAVGYTSFPVHARDVVFVVTSSAGIAEVPPTQAAQIEDYLASTLHARRTEAGQGIAAYVWTPPRGVQRVTVP